MTAVHLLVGIIVVVVAQVAILLGLATLRVRREFRASPDRVFRLAPIRMRVLRKAPETADGSVCSFTLAPLDQTAPAFMPGQYLTIHAHPAGTQAPAQRCYSLSNAPCEGFLRISVKRVAGGRVSPWLHDCVAAGDVLEVGAPAGTFHLEDGDTPVVLISGGIGITPMMSMLEYLYAMHPSRRVLFLHGCRNGRELAFAARLRELAASHPSLRLHRWFSAPDEADVQGRDYDHPGRMGAKAVEACLPAGVADIYLCGPGAMMRDLVTSLREAGVPEPRIHFEAFGPSAMPAVVAADVPAGSPRTVEFGRTGKCAVLGPGTSVLELAESVGARVTAVCRAGACGNCQTRIVSGTVGYGTPPAFSPDPGTCLPCVCKPTSDLVLDA